MIEKPEEKEKVTSHEFKEGTDYYFENGLMVLTAEFLLKRGYCCGSGCRHCPYPEDPKSLE
ncbi:MAG TPA: DUF5522 domain-containing protein [Pyrinomonadaceae bacterium]|nr:DUF5522 domain-containing protein [Pyrinomonadaceae bacterium]